MTRFETTENNELAKNRKRGNEEWTQSKEKVQRNVNLFYNH